MNHVFVRICDKKVEFKFPDDEEWFEAGYNELKFILIILESLTEKMVKNEQPQS